MVRPKALATPREVTPEPTPAPSAVELRNPPPTDARVGLVTAFAVRLAGGGRPTPVVYWATWYAWGPSDYDPKQMATTGGGRFAADVFIPYAEDYAAGFQYFIAYRTGGGRLVAWSPLGGATHPVPALARQEVLRAPGARSWLPVGHAPDRTVCGTQRRHPPSRSTASDGA
jgi:hypothetical protein